MRQRSSHYARRCCRRSARNDARRRLTKNTKRTGSQIFMTITRCLTLYLSAGLFTLAASSYSSAQDWPQWRGPNRDGVVASFAAPKVWPEKLKTIWKVPVGIGHSSPVVVGKRVYLHSRLDENEVTSCFDLDTGKQLWSDRYPAKSGRYQPALSR